MWKGRLLERRLTHEAAVLSKTAGIDAKEQCYPNSNKDGEKGDGRSPEIQAAILQECMKYGLRDTEPKDTRA